MEKEIFIDINDLKPDSYLYPRDTVDVVAVESYTQAIEAGSKFPPIVVDRATMRVIDGEHRWRAHRKAGRKKISVQFVDVADDKDFFERAVTANIEHGVPYSTYQKKKIRIKAEQLGIDEIRIATALRIPVERIRSKPIKSFTTEFLGQPVPTKNADSHMVGKILNAEQFEVHKTLGGKRQTDYFHTSKKIIETELTDWKNPVCVRQLIGLCNLLIRKLSEKGYGSELIKPFAKAR